MRKRYKNIGMLVVVLFAVFAIFSIYTYNTFADHKLLPEINSQFKSHLNKPNILNTIYTIDTNSYRLKYSKRINLTDSLKIICKQLTISRNIDALSLSSLIYNAYLLQQFPDYRTSQLFNHFHVYWNDSMNVYFSGNQNLFQRFLTDDKYIIKEVYSGNLYTQETWLKINLEKEN